MDRSDLFQKTHLDGGSRELSIICKANANALSESRRFVISNSSGVSECFQDSVTLQDLILTEDRRYETIHACDASCSFHKSAILQTSEHVSVGIIRCLSGIHEEEVLIESSVASVPVLFQTE